MIKKNTKIIFTDGPLENSSDLAGGMPLSKGEIISFYPNGEDSLVKYEVIDKEIDYLFEGDDHIVNITYTLAQN
ncbi:hypothetical protein KJ641_00210 [Patescibacteria group bacterium]|nr:hypothetical protein [Patescibacteria group bacterium]MBU1895282.1 hypothetical protein [Patescibacteria group bacterium]